MTGWSARLLVSFALLSASAGAFASPSNPGGQGKLTTNTPQIPAPVPSCIAVASHGVVEICADYTVNWKMWALMGEPVENYVLSWRLKSISFERPGGRGAAVKLAANAIPSELQHAVAEIEMYIEGYVIGPNYSHSMNTGASVRAGAGSSFDVPGSPEWARFFTSGTYNLCNNPGTFLSAEAAQDIFKQGVKLTSLELCKDSSFTELEDLGSAIDAMCRSKVSAARYGFCPKQEEKQKPATADPIDDAFAKLEGRPPSGQAAVAGGTAAQSDPVASSIDDSFVAMEANRRAKLIAQAKARAAKERRDQITGTCRAQVAQQDNCLMQTCGPRPEEHICKSWSSAPVIFTHSGSGLQLPIGGGERTCTEYETLPTPEYSAWSACTAVDRPACYGASGKRQSVDGCVEEQIRAAPPLPEPTLIEDLQDQLRKKLGCELNPAGCKKSDSIGGVRG